MSGSITFWLSLFVPPQASPWTSLGWFTLWMAPWSGGLIRMGSSQRCWVPMTWHLLGLSAVTLLWTFLRYDSGLVLFLQNASLRLHPICMSVSFPRRSDKEVMAQGELHFYIVYGIKITESKETPYKDRRKHMTALTHRFLGCEIFTQVPDTELTSFRAPSQWNSTDSWEGRFC